MKGACEEFRGRLASLLAGRVAPAELGEGGLGELAWHEHLLACADCRELLSAEEALEQLLASLPEPKLPRALAERVLSRLEPLRASDAALDALLDLTLAAPAPAELSRRVLAKLAAQRELERAEQRLDHMLGRVPAPRVPARLAAQILAGLESQRERVVQRTLRPVRATHAKSLLREQLPRRGTSQRWLYALAASLAIACGIAAWLLSTSQHDVRDENGVANSNTVTPQSVATDSSNGASSERAPVESASNDPTTNEPPQELLASLDLLEAWDLVTDDSLDARLNTLDNFDELLLSIDADSSATDTHENDAVPSTETPSKG